ncbi:hypothetical protein [Nocardia sp. NPDC002869]|uniref:hypothetical protein n=1 Tax=Nocardia sp. NPDC002869 TaxID=3161032 RepID=UPI00398D0845
MVRIPANWGGGRDGPRSRDGFWYDRTGQDAEDRPTVVIRYGGVGRRMLRSACTAAAAFAHGHPYDTVVDTTTTGTPAELARAVLRRERTVLG